MASPRSHPRVTQPNRYLCRFIVHSDLMDDDFWTRRHHYIHHSVLIQPVHDHRFCALAMEGPNFARIPHCCYKVMAVGHEKE